MTELTDFISGLFISNGYESIPQPNQNMPLAFKNKVHDDYWLVAESTLQYEHQSELYDWFKENIVSRSSLAEKNTSLLLLVDTDSQQDEYDEVEIENDPLYFKKYVLPYDNDSFHEMEEKVANSQEGSFDSLIMNNDTFEAIRNGEKYATLLYTIVHKLPFIPIHVVTQQAKQQVFSFSNQALEEIFDSLDGLPTELREDDVISFINNYLDADNND